MKHCWMAQTITFRNKVSTNYAASLRCLDRTSAKHVTDSPSLCIPYPNSHAQVTQLPTLPTTRSLCEVRGTVLYITTDTDLYTGSTFYSQAKKVRKTVTLEIHELISSQIHSLFASMPYFNTITLHLHPISQVPDPLKGWPTGLLDWIEQLEETKTAHLPRVVCLGIERATRRP